MARPPASFLLLPAEGETTVAQLRRKVGSLALRALLTLPLGAGPAGFAPVQQQLARVLARRPRALRAAALQIDALTPLLMLVAGVGRPAEAVERALPALLAPLGLGRLWPQPSAPALETPLPAGLAFSRRDSNPLAMQEDHPDKAGNAVDLGGRPEAEWVDGLTGALGLIEAHLPRWFTELPQWMQRIVPTGFHDQLHLSASYREAPGLAYLTLHPNRVTMAEALIHESQHSKLNLLSWLDPVLHNGRTCWTPSPVRPDLRPLMGVLLAVHAFVPVAALHERLAAGGHPLTADPWFARRRAEVLAGNEGGMAILRENAEPSAVGRRLLNALESLHGWLVDQAGGLRPAPAGAEPALPPG